MELFFRDLVKKYPDGRGHMNQAGHNYFAPLLAKEIENRWKITLTQNGQIV
jgi:hypothetical protein